MGTYTDDQNVRYDCKRTDRGTDFDGTPIVEFSAIVIRSPDAAGDVSIPASFVFSGNKYSVWAIDNGAFQGNDKLTSVQIPSGVRSMGTGAFAGCVNLKSASIEAISRNNSYYGLTEITNSAFMDCYALAAINLPESVTKIEQSAFKNCSSLSAITIPNTVQSIGDYAFNGCSNLKSIFIPASVKNIAPRNVFQGCSSLTEVRVSEENTAYDSRNNCNAIVETATNTLMTGCANTLIPSSVAALGMYCFAGSGISSADIPGTIKSIPYGTFQDCSALTSITIRNGVETLGYSAFSSCASLTAVEIPASVKEIQGNPFSGCSTLSTIVVDNANTVYDSRDGSNTIMETATNTILCGCKDSRIPGDAVVIGGGAFSGIGLESLVIPEGIREIGSGAFMDCDNLVHLSIPGSVETIGTRFLGTCRKLEYIEAYMTDPCKLDEDAFSWYWTTYIPGYGPMTNHMQSYPTVYIPKGTKEKYIANGWGFEDGDGYKSNLIEMEGNTPTAITSVSGDNEAGQYYDLNGRKLSTPHRGINIVRGQDGRLRKIVF